jgi:hypothetical protein
LLFIFLKKKRETEFLLAAAVLFKTEFVMELGFDLLFSEGKRRSEQD